LISKKKKEKEKNLRLFDVSQTIFVPFLFCLSDYVGCVTNQTQPSLECRNSPLNVTQIHFEPFVIEKMITTLN
jgi:hypothetical protein